MTVADLRRVVRDLRPRAIVVQYGGGSVFAAEPGGGVSVTIAPDTRYNGPRFATITGRGATRSAAIADALAQIEARGQ